MSAGDLSRAPLGPADLEELYRAYHGTVRRWLAARLPGVPQEVEDLVQETFTRAGEDTRSWDPVTTPAGAWLCGWVAAGVLDRYWRGRWRQRQAEAIAVEAIRLGQTVSVRERDARPVSARVVSALARLTPGQRQALQLRYLDGLTCEQAGELVGKTPNTIASHSTSGRRRMRAELADIAPPPGSPLAQVSKKAALHTAFGVVGPDAGAALAWLAGHGVRVNTSYAYEQARGARAASRPMTSAVDTHVSIPAIPSPRQPAEASQKAVAA